MRCVQNVCSPCMVCPRELDAGRQLAGAVPSVSLGRLSLHKLLQPM